MSESKPKAPYPAILTDARYNAMGPELTNGRFHARHFMHKYNNYFPDDATPESLTADREVMLRTAFGHVGKDVFIEPPLNIDYGCNISIGDGFYSNFKYVLLLIASGHCILG